MEQNDDTSSYIIDGNSGPRLDLGGLFSSQFSNIKPISRSRSGGVTEVLTATRYGRRFILKSLKEQYRDDPIYTLAMAKEFEIGIMLEHQNIRRTLSLEPVEGLGKAIVLEYVDGLSLDEMLKSGSLTISQARLIARQIADALSYLHGKRIYHRDLKPSNVLVMHPDNAVKLIDFNLSDNDQFIILKNPAGTRRYMAPEQLSPDAKPSPTADIYSFGAIIDELAAAAGDERLAEIARQCKNPEPDKRPQSVSQIGLPATGASVAQALSDFISSKALTWVLGGIGVALAATILYLQYS